MSFPYQHLLDLGTFEPYQDPILYDHEYKHRRTDLRFYQELARTLAKKQGSQLRILELGCGTGRLLVRLARDRHSIVGVDLAKPMLDYCAQKIQKLAKEKQANVKLIEADFCNLPLKRNQKFDLILCPFHSMMHLYTREQLEKFLGQVKKYLAPHGKFVFDVSNPDVTWLSRDAEKRWSKTRFRFPKTGEWFLYSTNHIYDPVHQMAWIRVYYEPLEGASTKTLPTMVNLMQRQYFPEELESLLHYNGFTIEKRFGDFDSGPLTIDSDEQIIQACVL